MSTLISLLKRLESKESYKKFKRIYPESYLCSIFCILNKNEKESDRIEFNFFIPKENKVAIFNFPFDEFKVSNNEGNFFEKIDSLEKIKIGVENIFEKVEKIKKEKKIKHQTSRVIAVLLKDKWSLTCISDLLDILKFEVNPFNEEIIKIEKKKIGDIFKK